ncbi:uncharacterized protein LOC110057985 [Orbicella faveolata]|uniref:uncharacterized protein LOC110057985 n=1 Tax=Orbicella faveolata TaxID=48498 RepID=UPI0009E3C52C|nr:uncharacterized protein LOC110057985 [Orbicella faveolata]XP_020620244.1 uncharacterized protein LOC110057985 [Orbicella faveolata]
MGAEHSIPLQHRRMEAALFERSILDELLEITEESSVSSEQIEHAWDPEDCSPMFKVLSDRLTARRLPSPFTTDGIRGKKGYRQGRHVWEITWERDERGFHAVIGITLPQAPLQSLGYISLIGSNSESWGWNLSKKVSFHSGEESPYPANNPGFFVPDTVYCILDMDNRTLSFATEDTHLGVAFRNLPRHPLEPLCPCASAVYGNCDIKMKYLGRGDNFLAKLQAANEKVPSSPSSPTVETPPQSVGLRSPPQAPNASSGPVNASECYTFHHSCGENITVMLDGKKAKRIDALQHFNHGVLLTSQPLQVDELFEVRLDSKVSKWYGSLDIGATTVSPENVELPSTITSMAQGTTFVLSSDKIVHNGEEMTTISKDLDSLSVGDRVGVMRMSDNSLHFFINGVDVGKKIKTIPSVLYGVVDVFGQAEEVTITGGTAETQSSNKEKVDSVSVMVRMNNTISILKEGSFGDMLSITGKVAKDILEPLMEIDDRKLQQKYGDHLSEIGAPHHLTKLLLRLMDVGMETRDGWVGMYVVRRVFWNYSFVSLKMARGLARSGALMIMLNDLDTCGTSSSQNERTKYLVSSAINTLHNCSKASENRPILCDLRAKERIAPFLKADDLKIVVPAILTLAYITSEEEKKLLEAESRVISYLIGMLRSTLGRSNLEFSSEGATWSCHEIADGLSNLVVNEKNMEAMLDRDALPLFISLIVKGGATEKECAANALWIIAKTSKGKAKIKETANAMEELTRLSKSGNQAIQEAAKRVLLELKETRTTRGTDPFY